MDEYKVISGKGERCIISHLRSLKTGRFDGFDLMFRGSKPKKPEDCHTEMDSSVFLDWLKTKVLPKLKQLGKKCVLVLARATYLKTAYRAQKTTAILLEKR